MSDNELAASRMIMLGDLDLAGQDDRQALPDLAHFDQRLARAVGTEHAEPAQALDLRRGQRGKHLVSPRVDDRWCWHGHS
jgi:hypothetical protein